MNVETAKIFMGVLVMVVAALFSYRICGLRWQWPGRAIIPRLGSCLVAIAFIVWEVLFLWTTR